MDKSNYGYDKNKQEVISKKFNELALKYNYGNKKTTNNVWICVMITWQRRNIVW